MKDTAKVAAGAMMAAVCVVIMLLGAVVDLGTYAAALLAGVAMIPYGQEYGRKYQLLVFAAAAVLSFMIVPNIEQNLMFLGLYGWYPALRPSLEKLPKALSYAAKFLVFNLCFISIEALVMLVLVPEAMGSLLFVIFIITANVTFNFAGKIINGEAVGNGRLDAVSNALKSSLDISYSLITYQEHALEVGSKSKAVCYVGIQTDKGVAWGAGIHTDIIDASVSALMSAVNNSGLIEF